MSDEIDLLADDEPVSIMGLDVPPEHQVSFEEACSGFHGPAVFANRIAVTTQGTVARIAFLEKAPDQVTYFRAAVLLTPDQISGLRIILQKLEDELSQGSDANG